MLLVELAMLAAGVVVLITGKIKISQSRIATGVGARIAGLALMMPLPLGFLVLVMIGLQEASKGRRFDVAEWQGPLIGVELSLVALCSLFAFGIALAASSAPEKNEGRRRSEAETEDADWRARRPERPAEEEEEVLWAVLVEQPPEGTTTQLPVRSAPLSVPRREPPRPISRPRPAARSGNRTAWWIAAGVAAGLFLVLIAVGGVLFWSVFSAWREQAGGRSGEPSRTVVEGPGFMQPQRQPDQWEQRPPENNGDQGPQPALPPGGLQPPGGGINPQPPAEPPFKPIVIAQPSAPHLNIRPPALPAERVVRMLPSAISDVAVGGGGRFLILYLAREHKLAIFDVNAARVVKYLSFADDIVFAAGMDKLLVALPEKNVLQRWSLTTFQRELSVPLAARGRVLSLTMGSASNGPLLIRENGEGPASVPSLSFHDIRTLKPLEVKWGDNRGLGPPDAPYIRASANGKVFGLLGWGPQTLVWDDGRVTITHLFQGGGLYVLPGPDGKAVFTESAIYTELLKPAAGGANVKGAMPATHGRYYMAGQSVYLMGDSRPLLTVPAEKPEPGGQDPRLGFPIMNLNEQLALDKRGYFIPDAKLLIHIPLRNDQLVLRRLDVEAGLEKSGIDYLFVVSQAPAKAKKGATYRYQLSVKSKKGGVKYRLESAPKGMKVSGAGLVTWDVPRSLAEREVDVIVTVSDRSGQEVFHAFRILPGDQGEEQAPVAVNVPPEPVKPAATVVELEARPAERPAPTGSGIQPPALAGDQVEVRLPSAVLDAAVGGGGRYLVLRLSKERKLALFDVNAAKIVRWLPADDGEIHFAAGQNKLLVSLGGQKVLQRWDLATGRREAVAPLPVQEPILALSMGSASHGPLLIAAKRTTTLVDVRTLKPVELQGVGPRELPAIGSKWVRASADGQVFAFRPGVGAEPHNVCTLTLRGGRVSLQTGGGSASLLVPSSDGRALYTAYGVLNSQLHPVAPAGAANASKSFLPAEHGSYYLMLEPDRRKAPPHPRPGVVGGVGAVSFFVVGQEKPLARLDNVEGVYAENIAYGESGEPLAHDRRIHYIPDAHLLVTIPTGEDRLLLRRFDVAAALEKSGLDYLLVASSPPARVKKGTLYTYPLMVKSKKGRVKVRLDYGPPGMKLSTKGVLTWPVPQDFAEAQADVLLTVSDAGGQEVYHRFAIIPGDQGEEQGPAVRDVPPEPVQRPAKPVLPPVRPGPIVRPPQLSADKVVKTLPSLIADVAVGGGGRYLILHLPKERKLAVFDVSAAKVAGYVPVAADNVKFTAGRDKLIVVLGDENVIQRWDLATLRQEATAPLPVRDAVTAVVLGSASGGPLLVASAKGAIRSELFFLDVSTLKRLPIQRTGDGHIHIQEGDGVRASADGRVFAIWRSYSIPQGIQTLVLQGGEARGYYHHDSAGHLVPGPDGKLIYTAEGRYTRQVEALDNREEGLFCVPATQGDYFLSIQWKDLASRRKGEDGTLAVHLPGDLRPLARLPQVELPLGLNRPGRERMSPDKRMYFIPAARLIVIIPDRSDRLVLHRFDVEAALEKSTLDYLLITSSPPARVKKGTLYTYPLVVKSKKGGVKLRLDYGPSGMKLSDKGVLSWPVPKDFAEPQADVLLTVSDAGGQEVFHRFSIVPGDWGEEPAPAARDVPPGPVKQPEPVKPPEPTPRKEAAVRELRQIRISKNSFVNGLVFTPDGRELLSAGDDGRVRRWDMARGKELSSSFDAHPRVTMLSVALSADGKILATSAIDNTAKVWETDTNKLLATCSERAPMIRAALSPDGKVLATATAQLRLWEAASGRPLADLTDRRDIRARFIETLVFSPDGKRLACTGSPNTVRVWDVASRKEEATLRGHSDLVMALAFSSDGRTLAAASMDRTIKLWDLTTKKERLTLKGHEDPLNALAFSPDGTLLVSGAGATRFNPGHRGEVKLWDAATGKLLSELRGHTDGVGCVAFSPDGKTIASSGRDRTVRLWDVSAFTVRPAAASEK